ncbi:MAG: VOC family protein [Myxococcales bacterium]
MLLVDHVDLNVGSLETSVPFYDLLLPWFGLKKVLTSDDVVGYTDGHFALYLIPCDTARKFQSHRVGLNHLAFKAESREKVDALHAFLKEHNVDVLAAPREATGHAEGYYSFFFRDPNRIRLEYAFCPRR